ncbi:uncharacterized protein AB675_168 [Cyphellophora attinorum]|uniref:Uncharacterized protein n=1 Tax=Cyphellophora attinorum TaxID=1664694 RepID=A0A0N0NK88_9EURO|nr:uncharacterized protein AB675_168 [Phialophora attinorum]KPI37758.1 hypothetical protein AB675_168 [Phialophora attinorum]
MASYLMFPLINSSDEAPNGDEFVNITVIPDHGDQKSYRVLKSALMRESEWARAKFARWSSTDPLLESTLEVADFVFTEIMEHPNDCDWVGRAPRIWTSFDSHHKASIKACLKSVLDTLDFAQARGFHRLEEACLDSAAFVIRRPTVWRRRDDRRLSQRGFMRGFFDNISQPGGYPRQIFDLYGDAVIHYLQEDGNTELLLEPLTNHPELAQFVRSRLANAYASQFQWIVRKQKWLDGVRKAMENAEDIVDEVRHYIYRHTDTDDLDSE